MRFPLQTDDNVYTIGAAGWWLKKWRVTDHDREIRIFAAIERRLKPWRGIRPPKKAQEPAGAA
jgi:hypothetical protein